MGKKIVSGSKEIEYRYTRKIKADIQSQCTKLDHITILEGPNRFWIYDGDAVRVASIFGFEAHKTKKGHTLVYDKSLHEDFINNLTAQGFNCVIVYPKTISEILVSEEHVPEAVFIEEDKRFKLKDSNEQINKYKITNRIDYERTIIRRPDGSTEIIRVPILIDPEDSDTALLSPRAPLAALLIGKRVGDIITYQGMSQMIVEIESLS